MNGAWSSTPLQRATLLSVTSSGTSFSATMDNAGGGGLITVIEGIDWTASRANPVQCFTQLVFNTNSAYFFWDSQSTGEGNGVRWSWRGSLALALGDAVTILGQASASITWGAIAWGYQLPPLS